MFKYLKEIYILTMKRIIASIVFAIVLISPVSAILLYAEWETKNNSVSINTNENVSFSVFVGTMNPPITLDIYMYNSSNSQIYSFENNTIINATSFSKSFVFNTNDNTTGDIRISGSDVFTEMNFVLYFTINEVPEINITNETEINETAENITAETSVLRSSGGGSSRKIIKIEPVLIINTPSNETEEVILVCLNDTTEIIEDVVKEDTLFQKILKILIDLIKNVYQIKNVYA